MANQPLIALLESLAAAEVVPPLSPKERQLLKAHVEQLREAAAASNQLASLPLPDKAPAPAATKPAPSQAVIRLKLKYQATLDLPTAQQAPALQRLADDLEASVLSKAEVLELSQAILPSDGPRYRSKTQALNAIKGRLMQRFRDAVRTAKLGGSEPGSDS